MPLFNFFKKNTLNLVENDLSNENEILRIQLDSTIRKNN